jgi:hypothetical protein
VGKLSVRRSLRGCQHEDRIPPRRRDVPGLHSGPRPSGGWRVRGGSSTNRSGESRPDRAPASEARWGPDRTERRPRCRAYRTSSCNALDQRVRCTEPPPHRPTGARVLHTCRPAHFPRTAEAPPRSAFKFM